MRAEAANEIEHQYLDATKAYEFTIRFGEETDTLDAEGAAIAKSDVRPTMAEVGAILPRFTGATASGAAVGMGAVAPGMPAALTCAPHC